MVNCLYGQTGHLALDHAMERSVNVPESVNFLIFLFVDAIATGTLLNFYLAIIHVLLVSAITELFITIALNLAILNQIAATPCALSMTDACQAALVQQVKFWTLTEIVLELNYFNADTKVLMFF
jgi:hypothetical protein